MPGAYIPAISLSGGPKPQGPISRLNAGLVHAMQLGRYHSSSNSLRHFQRRYFPATGRDIDLWKNWQYKLPAVANSRRYIGICTVPGVRVKTDSDTVMVFGSSGHNAGAPQGDKVVPQRLLFSQTRSECVQRQNLSGLRSSVQIVLHLDQIPLSGRDDTGSVKVFGVSHCVLPSFYRRQDSGVTIFLCPTSSQREVL